MNKVTLLSIIIFLLLSTSINAQQASGKVEKTTDKEQVSDGPKASWDKLIHDYGEITFKEKEKTEFTLTNTGNQPLLIVFGQTTCGCAHLEYDEAPILPGKSTKVTVTYHGTDLGDFLKTINIVTSADTDRTVLQVKGKVVEK